VVDRRRLNSVRCPDSELLTAQLELGPACRNCDDSGWKVVDSAYSSSRNSLPSASGGIDAV
jgi:hypothetical protein